ncbi:hypothetical protein WAF17_18975 [Bernardetia sp. ABR2-2B]|uniref:hypothetical protein n=1 Tax=Bernardetia sp. ABR2-2B TaxID=3127472 RepID=UPI0030CE63D4
MNLPSYKDIKKLDFWVPPQPCSLMLTLYDKENKEIKVDMLPTDEGIEVFNEEEYTPPPHPKVSRRLYINEELVEFNLSLEKEVIDILSNLIRDNRLGHPKGLTVIMAQEMIDYFK